MKLVLADIHIKLGQKNVPKNWAINRYKLFFDQVDEIEKQVDTVVVAGDIFDRVPTLEELELYFDFIYRRKKNTIISTGNHEATKKGKSFFKYLKEVTERLNPLVEVVVDYIKETDDYYVVPYEFIKDEKVWQSLEPKVVFTHIRAEIPPHVKPEIPLEWIERFPLVVAGDLHSHSNTQANIVYPGSPMTTSFHRDRVETGYLLLDMDWGWVWKPFELPQLIRKTVSSVDEMVATEYDHTIYELHGNIHELSGVENSELLDKKLIKRSSDTALVLDQKMSIAQELEEYLRYIQELDEEDVSNILGVFNEYSNTTID